MKKLLTLSLAIASIGAFANTVYLNGSSVEVGSNAATLEKTANTPSNVTLNLVVPTSVERCDDADMRTRRTRVTNGPLCGYDSVAYRCSGGYYGSGRVGPRYNPPRRGGPRGPRNGGGYYGRRHGNRAGLCYRTVARSCVTERSYCANPQYVTIDKLKSFKLSFSKFSKDASIAFSLDQNQSLELEVLGMNDSCVKKTVYVNDSGEKTGAKLKLKRKCR